MVVWNPKVQKTTVGMVGLALGIRRCRVRWYHASVFGYSLDTTPPLTFSSMGNDDAGGRIFRSTHGTCYRRRNDGSVMVIACVST